MPHAVESNAQPQRVRLTSAKSTPKRGRQTDCSPPWWTRSTPRSSQAVPHPSTSRALRRLTSEVERDPVYSTSMAVSEF